MKWRCVNDTFTQCSREPEWEIESTNVYAEKGDNSVHMTGGKCKHDHKTCKYKVVNKVLETSSKASTQEPAQKSLQQELTQGAVEIQATEISQHLYSRFEDDINQQLFSTDELCEWKQEWQDMPEYINNDFSPYKSIIVHFANEADIKSFAILTKQKITQTTK